MPGEGRLLGFVGGRFLHAPGRDGLDVLAEAIDDGGRQLAYRGRGVVAGGDELHLVPVRHVQGHDRDERLGVDLDVLALEADLALELLRQAREHGRRAGMQAGRVGDDHGLRDLGVADRLTLLAAALTDPRLGDGVVTGGHEAGTRLEPAEDLRVGDDHLGEQALGVGGHLVEVELDEGLAGADLRTERHPGGEALASHGDGVEADVQQHLEPALVTHRHGVLRGVDERHLAVAGREEHIRDRVDGDALTDHLLREHRVGDLFDRDEHSGERCDQHHPRTSGGFHHFHSFMDDTRAPRLAGR